ncbi:MAG: hypothetical protein V1888_00960 [archaeon]
MKEIENVLRILREAKKFVQEDKPNELKSLSNQTIHAATISQDADNVIVAVLIYSIGKVMERNNYRNMDGWKDFYDAVLENLELAAGALEKGDIKNTRVYLGMIRNSLNKIEGDLGVYVKDVFRKAEINKAFKLYEHGLSTEKTAEMLGVSLWDLASYIGQSHIGDSKIAICMPEKDRLKIAEEFFG